MKWCLSFFVILVSSTLLGQGFQFFKPFKECMFYSEDIGVSAEWGRVQQQNNIDLGVYYSLQTSALGAGVWYHTSGFVKTTIHPNPNDLNFSIGLNGGVSFLLLEAKVTYNVSRENFSFVPAIGLGINRILYGMLDYYVASGQNALGTRLVLRIPILTSVDKNISGYTPAYN